jgi:predicted nucleic acid-binding protein
LTADLILDASATLAWCFEDERSADADALLERLATSVALVPGLWHVELANALLAAERRRRLTAAEIEEFYRLLRRLTIETDDPRLPPAPLLALARAHRLTVYDATYLDLALRRNLPLATRDAALGRAAGAAGVALLPA